MNVLRPEFEGYVDHIEDGCIIGWAWTPKRPHDAIEVELLIDGVLVSKCAAARYRPDLEQAGKGDGQHAFEATLPADIRDGVSHQVRVVYGGTNTDLYGSPRAVSFDVGRGSGAEPQRPVPRGATYHSRFGGLWTDLSNAKDVVDGKCSLRWVSPAEAILLRTWIDNGFVILPQAVPHDVIDQLDAEVEQIWKGASSARPFVEFWEDGTLTIQPAGPRFREKRIKLLDLYAHSARAREVVFAPPILRVLTLLFERPALAFQSLYFRWGSQQDIHQDTAFVKVSSPLEFAASWVALEDIQPNAGELEYYVGSHRLEDYLFEGERKWMPLPFNGAVYEAFIASLDSKCRARGLERARFLPRKGDVLIWSADLAHGGRKDVTEGVTRKSLVTHYCPVSCEPIYGPAGILSTRHKYNDDAYYTFPPRGGQ